eukprot:GDKI01021211.1.p2 GENE.GDKI01021211.1~~GDKI01021211.1.p2  ORF type:complete len:377 (-),score=114.69 GDKI01021211.1:17-1147(-)
MRTPAVLLCSLFLASLSHGQLVVPASRAKQSVNPQPELTAAADEHHVVETHSDVHATAKPAVSLARTTVAPSHDATTHHDTAVHVDDAKSAVAEQQEAAAHSDTATHIEATTAAPEAAHSTAQASEHRPAVHAADRKHKTEAPAHHSPTPTPSPHEHHDTAHHEKMHGGSSATTHHTQGAPAAEHEHHTATAATVKTQESVVDGGNHATTTHAAGERAVADGTSKAPVKGMSAHQDAPKPTLIPEHQRARNTVAHTGHEQSNAGPIVAAVIGLVAAVSFIVFAVYVLAGEHLKRVVTRCKRHGVRGVWMEDEGVCAGGSGLEMCDEEKGDKYAPPAMTPIDTQLCAPQHRMQIELVCGDVSRRSTTEDDTEAAYLL